MSDKITALTFDDGPNTTTTAEVLDKLEKHNIPASFFLIGDNINAGSEVQVRRAVSLGCEIQNHSKTHSTMTGLSPEMIRAEIEFTDRRIFDITGKHTSFFRPPYIAVNDTMFENISLPFIAGIGAEDWEDSVSAEERSRRIIEKAVDGCIILLHDSEGNSKTVTALDTIIPALKEKGFEFVTVSELFRRKGVTPAHGIVYSVTGQTEMYYYTHVLKH